MNNLRLAWILLRRDIKNGELSLLLLALIIAVTASATIGLFADRLQRTMTAQAGQFLAGDLALSGSQLLPETIPQYANTLGLQQAQTAEFSTMLMEKQQMLLVAAKAVSSHYPLRGQLKIQRDNQEQISEQGPLVGEAWVDGRVLNALQIQLGDKIQLGEHWLTVSAQLNYEPDKAGDFYAFLPRVMFNWQDLAATEVIQPGSRVSYAYQFNGSEAVIKQFRELVQHQLPPGQKILDIYQDRPELGTAFRRAERYLGLSSVLVMVLAGVAIAMAAQRYSERHFDAVALLRCLGCRQDRVMMLFALQILMLGGLSCLLGCAFGWLGHNYLLYLLAALMANPLSEPSLSALVIAWASGMLLLLGFALPPLLRLRQVSAVRVLRRDWLPTPISVYLVYGLALGILTVLVAQYSRDHLMTLQLLAGIVVAYGLLSFLIALILKAMQAGIQYLGLSTRLAFKSLLQQQQLTLAQILAFTLTLSAMLLSYSVRNDLILNWQQQLPENTPNYFVINVLPDSKQAFADSLQQAGIQTNTFYPVVRGRLLTINQQTVTQRVSKESQGEAATQRELSLTTVPNLPEDNRIVAGEAWPPDTSGLVSVEQKLADNLGIKVGDVLGFSIGGAQLEVRVSSLRSLQWDTLKPNFYMIFSPGTIEQFPTTWMTSFYLPLAQKQLLNSWHSQFPALSLLDVGQWVEQIKGLLRQLTAAIDYLLCFALVAGVCVLLTSIAASLDQRLYQGALLRTLGASRALLLRIQNLEFALLGGVSGLLAVGIAELVRFIVYQKLLQLDFGLIWQYWLVLPSLATLIVVLAARWGLRPVLKYSPLRVFRQG